jgi:hypothetical protein
MKYSLGISVLALALLVGAPSAHAATPSIQVSEVVFEKGAKPPTCKASFTYKKPRAGETTTLFWRSRGADYMTGLYNWDKREVRGRQNIRFSHPGEQNFYLMFVGSGGVTTCHMRIFVKE